MSLSSTLARLCMLAAAVLALCCAAPASPSPGESRLTLSNPFAPLDTNGSGPVALAAAALVLVRPRRVSLCSPKRKGKGGDRPEATGDADKASSMELTPELVRAALDGDDRAIATLVDALTPVIHKRVGLALLRRRAQLRGEPRALVDDFIQDVFLELFRDEGKALRAWDPKQGMNLKNWVGLIASQRVHGQLRGAAQRAVLVDLELDGPAADLASHDDPEAQVTDRDELQKFTEVLHRLRSELSPRDQQLFELLIQQDLPARVVAERMNMATNTVQQWLSRFRRRLAEIWRNATSLGPPKGAS